MEKGFLVFRDYGVLCLLVVRHVAKAREREHGGIRCRGDDGVACRGVLSQETRNNGGNMSTWKKRLLYYAACVVAGMVIASVPPIGVVQGFVGYFCGILVCVFWDVLFEWK